MKSAAAVFILSLVGATASQGATVLIGHVLLSGADDISSRGYGRSIAFDLAAVDSSFQVSGACGDTTSENPGGNTATLSRATSNCGPLTVNNVDFVGRTDTVFNFVTAPVVLPVLDPGPNIGDSVLFTLSPAPFTLSARLTVVDRSDPSLVLIDADVTGSGFVTREGRAVREFDGVIRYLYESEFQFSNVPEPGAAWLVLAGGVVLFGARKVGFPATRRKY